MTYTPLSTTISSGTYTPTLTNVTNISATSANPSQWTRVGNIVTVFGQLNATITIATASEIGVSLPVASNFTQNYHCSGNGYSGSTFAAGTIIDADVTNDRARMRFGGLTIGGNGNIYYSFSYNVL